MVVIIPLITPNSSRTTFTTGDRPLVVQEALETTLCASGSYCSWLTPSTTVRSSPRADAGGLDDQIDPPPAPVQLRPVPLGGDGDALAVDDQRVLLGLDGALEGAVVAVVAQQVGVGLGVEEVVDGDDLEVRVAFQQGLVGLTSDPAEAVDPDSHRSSFGAPGGRSVGGLRAGPCPGDPSW